MCVAVGLGRGQTASVTPGPPKGQLQCLLMGSGVGGCGEEGSCPGQECLRELGCSEPWAPGHLVTGGHRP